MESSATNYTWIQDTEFHRVSEMCVCVLEWEKHSNVQDRWYPKTRVGNPCSTIFSCSEKGKKNWYLLDKVIVCIKWKKLYSTIKWSDLWRTSWDTNSTSLINKLLSEQLRKQNRHNAVYLHLKYVSSQYFLSKM